MRGATIVFDLDGTLVDTAPDLIGATNHVLQGLSRPPVDEEFMRPWISFGARRMIVEATRRQGLQLEETEISGCLETFVAFYEDNIAHASRPFDGVLATLDELAARDCRLAICTNKRESLSEKLLHALELRGRFHALVGRDTLPVCKPDPRHLTEAIHRAGGSPSTALMVGDSITDVDTARAAGVAILGVSFGYTDTPMRELLPDAVIDHYDQALNAIENLICRTAE